MAELRLSYFFKEEDVFESVVISRDATVDDLRDEIHKQCSKSYCKDVDARQLDLLKVDIDASGDAIHNFQAPDDATGIDLMMPIREVWPNEPVGRRLQICVRMISVEPARKRRRKEDDDNRDSFLDGPFGTNAFSSFAKFSELCKIQEQPSQRVANDRPHPDADHLPIALLYHGFGRFLDTKYSTGTSTDGTLDVNQQQFEDQIAVFMDAMNAYYHYGGRGRNENALQCVNDIFECYLWDPQPLASGMVFKDHHPNGHVLGSTNTIEVILQVKNELGSRGTDPTIELSAHYTQSLKENLTRKSISHFLFPALGIVVIGSHIGFYALAFEQRTRLVALTPLLPTTAERGNNWVKPALLNAFKAACVLRHHIHKDTEKFSTSQEESLPIQRNLPYVNEVAVYSPREGASTRVISFQIRNEVYRGQKRYPNQFLYLATLDDSDECEVIVKFTRRYCPALHSFCAEQRHAPQLLGYGMVPGGWHVVVTEKIKQQTSSLELHARNHLQTWSQNLKSLVNDFHDRGWVHGDLRVANLIVNNEEPECVMLIDFDWGGIDGSVCYPTSLLDEELEKPGRPSDLRITKEHDDYVLAFALDKLEKRFT